MTTETTETQFFPYAKQSIDDSDIEAVTSALKSPMITRGESVEAFERAVADYCGAAHAVAFSSGTAALHGAGYAANVDSQDRIISTTNTFVATVGAGIRYGARPVFVDVDAATGNVDLAAYREELHKSYSRGKTVATVVHFAGVPVDMHRFDSAIRDPNAFVIEDAAHALGTRYSDGNRVGNCQWSDVTVFSFHPAKTITAAEGGMALTHSAEIADRLRHFRNNGIERREEHLRGVAAPWYYEVDAMTGNYHMNDLQAALGLSQFERLDTFVEQRLRLMQAYHRELEGIDGVVLAGGEPTDNVAYHLCVALIDFERMGVTREKVMVQLRERGVGTQVHYIPLYKHPYFVDRFGNQDDAFPQTEEYYSKALSLPLYFDMHVDDVPRICAVLKEVLAAAEVKA